MDHKPLEAATFMSFINTENLNEETPDIVYAI